MATTVGQHSVATFTSPVNGTTPIDANTVRGNDNTMRVAYVDHDADPGIHVQSSTLASRPVAGTAGRKWITNDSGVYTLWFDDGTNWHPVSSENVALTVLAGENLVKGDVVKITGWNNGQDLPEVVKTTSAADTAFAVITATVSSGSMGYATNTGIVQDVNTAAYSVGTILYANGSGGFTSTKPTSGHYQPVAFVLRANASNGVYYVEFSTPRIVERSDNTASTVVLRDASGDFSAGTITATAVNATTLDLTNLEVTNIKAKDGTQAIAIADATGKLTISDGVLLSGLTASQAVFTDASKNLVSNAITGTGNVVMSASPTLTGTVTAATLNATTLGGTLSTAAQTNITSVGTLTNLTVTNPITGSVTGSSGSTTGNAATATALQTARNINGVSFNGTADITVTAAAGTLTGSTLASGVTASSLTSVGTLSSLTVSGAITTTGGNITRNGSGTAAGFLNVNNTGNDAYFGVNNSTGTTFAASAYDAVVQASASNAVSLSVAGIGSIVRATFAGATVSGNLAVDTNTLYVDSANNRVGIGTASPTSPLHVVSSGAGNMVLLNNTTAGKAGMAFQSNGTTAGLIGLSGSWEGDASTDMSLIAETGGSLRFYTNGSPNERAVIDTSGNLGLGVTTSAWNSVYRTIQVGTGTSISGRSDNATWVELLGNAYRATDGNWKYLTTATATRYQQDTGKHEWYIAPSGTAGNAISFTQALTLDASGNLNLGQASSALQSGGTGLTVYGSSASEIKFLNSTSGTAATDGTALVLSSSDFNINNRESGAILFGTANTERARITSGGALLVNTTAITYSSERFAVISAANSNAAAFKNDGGGSGANAYTVAVSNTASSGDNAFVVFATETSDTTRGSITYNRAGGVVAYNTTSDYRAKDVFGAWQDAGQTIDALTVYRGKMKGATIERPMLIAHEAQAVAPYCVTGEKNAVDADGNPIYQQMDHSVLVPLLIAEVQSLRARVAALEA